MTLRNLFLWWAWVGCAGLSVGLAEGDNTNSTEQVAAEEIVRKADAIRAPEQPFCFDLVVESFRANNKTGKMESQSKSGFQAFVGGYVEEKYRSLVRYTYPPEDKGKIMLMDGSVYWLYIPGTRNVLRLSPVQRLAGQASSADIASVNFQFDYDAKLVGEDKVKDDVCYLLELTAKDESVAYQRLKYWVAKESFRPMKTEFFAASGRLLKSAYYANFEEALGVARPMAMVIVDGINENKTTRITYANWRLKELADYMFRKTYLKNIEFD